MIASPLSTEAVHARLRAWAADPRGPVDRALVHKHHDMNVALSRVETLPGGRFLGQVHVVADHPFFFDHPVDHVPGLLLVEAARQFGIAVAHRHYDVPMDTVFSLSGLEVDFQRMAELDAPTGIVGAVLDPVYRGGQLRRMRFSGGFVQGDRELGQMTGTWRMASPELWARMRRGRR